MCMCVDVCLLYILCSSWAILFFLERKKESCCHCHHHHPKTKPVNRHFSALFRNDSADIRWIAAISVFFFVAIRQISAECPEDIQRTVSGFCLQISFSSQKIICGSHCLASLSSRWWQRSGRRTDFAPLCQTANRLDNTNFYKDHRS